MDLLTKDQIKKITEIIESHVGVILKTATGQGNVDPKLLKKLKLPADTPSMIQSSFILGKLVQLLEENDIKKMTFDELKKKAQEYSLSTVERNSLNYAKHNAARYVTGLGQKMTNAIMSKINNQSQAVNLKVVEQNIIKDTVAQGILKQKTRGQLASDLGHETGDWKRDWQRVAHTELWDARLQGEVITILQGDSIYSNTKRGDTIVFRRPAPDGCSHCKRLYLEADQVTPKLFKLKDLMANGDNVGKKVADWQPIVGVTHPNCNCPLAVMPDGFEFDSTGEIVYVGLKGGNKK